MEVASPRKRLALAATLLGAAAAGCALAGAALADERPLPGIDRIVVRKSDHVLEAWSGSTRVKTYRVAIGSGGAGPKRYEGDGRTPEGTYRIDQRHRSAAFHRFLHVSYPNAADRAAFRQGLRDGTIARGSRIGGAIGIHGEPRTFAGLGHKLFDWTAGCIALDDEEIEELFVAVRPNAVVVIEP